MSATERFKASWARWRERRWVRWAGDALFLTVAVLVIGLWQTRGHVEGPAPDFTLPTLGGAPVSLAGLRGKPVLLAFWAPWCGVCKTESQNLGWARRLLGERAHVLSVASAWDDERQVRQYVQERGVDYPVALDAEGVADRFQVQAYPTLYFVDAQGQVKRSAVGYTTTLGLVLRTLVGG